MERLQTSCPSAGLTGEVEEAVGEDEDEVEDGDEGDATRLGLTSTSLVSFRSTCLLFAPAPREQGEERVQKCTKVWGYKTSDDIQDTNTQKYTSGSLKERQLSLHSSAHARALSKSMISNTNTGGNRYTVQRVYVCYCTCGVCEWDRDLDRGESLKSGLCCRELLMCRVQRDGGKVKS